MAIIAFDLDGTLIHESGPLENTPRYEIIELLMRLSFTNTIYVWSGGGIEYAHNWCQKLGLLNKIHSVIEKGSIQVDLSFDNEWSKFGKVNIKV